MARTRSSPLSSKRERERIQDILSKTFFLTHTLNTNYQVAFAEFDNWLLDLLVDEHGDEEGNRLYGEFHPSYIRAYEDAKDKCDNGLLPKYSLKPNIWN